MIAYWGERAHRKQTTAGSNRTTPHPTAGRVLVIPSVTLTQSREYQTQDVMVPDLEAVDHRIVGHELVGQFSSRWNESWQELARDLTFRITDVLALSSEALLRLTTTTGVWKVGAGR